MKRIVTIALLLAATGIDVSAASTPQPGNGATVAAAGALGRKRITTIKPGEEVDAFADCKGGPVTPANTAEALQNVQKVLKQKEEELAAMQTQLTAATCAKILLEEKQKQLEDQRRQFLPFVGLETVPPYTDPSELEKTFAYIRGCSAARQLCQASLTDGEMTKLIDSNQAARTTAVNQMTALRQKAFDENATDSIPALLKRGTTAIIGSLKDEFADNGNGQRGLQYALTILFAQNTFNKEHPQSSFVMGKEDRTQFAKTVDQVNVNIINAITTLFGIHYTLNVIKRLAEQDSTALDLVQNQRETINAKKAAVEAAAQGKPQSPVAGGGAKEEEPAK